MTDAVQIALIVAAAPTLLAGAAFIASLRNGAKIQGVHVDLNSRLSQLITASKAEGRQEERDSVNGHDALK